MRRKLLISMMLCFGVMFAQNTLATDLIHVFQDAVANDPTYHAAIANFHAVKEGVPISVANFLPQLSLNGSVERVRVDNEAGANIFFSNDVFYNNRALYGATLNQSIFNFANWATLANAQAQAKAQGASLNAAYQNLIIRAARAYFNVLKASEDLRLNISEKKALARQLEQNRERYKVGLIAITSVYETQASYDTAIAREIASQNEFANRIEQLREITGKKYYRLMGVKGAIPLNPPRPTILDQWICVAKNQNYTLLAARYNVDVARANIKLAFSGHMPVIDGYATFAYTFDENPFGQDLPSFDKRLIGGIAARLPVFNGGGVVASTHQAQYLYQESSSELERVFRSVVSETTQSYLGVISGVSKIEADRQTISSRQNSLKATEAAQEVGTRTMVDVLQAQTILYNAEQIYARDQYDFLLNNLILEENAGTLSPEDLARTNHLLVLPVKMIQYSEIGKVERLGGPRPENIKPIDLTGDVNGNGAEKKENKGKKEKAGMKE